MSMTPRTLSGTRRRLTSLAAVLVLATVAAAFVAGTGSTDTGQTPIAADVPLAAQTATAEPTAAQPTMEATELEKLYAPRQEQVQSVLRDVRPHLEKDPGFAGLWVDTEAGWVVDIATTGDPVAVEAALTPFEDRGVPFRVRKVDYTHAELRALQDRVANDAEAWRELGVTITLIGVDVKANRLKIGVETLTSKAESSLQAAYGDRVKLEQQGPAFAF
jgi:hypothetical protein